MVEQIPVPGQLRRLSELDRIDYEDAFLVAPAEPRRSPEAWAREVLASAPAEMRRALLAGWSSLGLRLDPEDERRVLGWQPRRSDREAAVLASDSPLGIAAELVFQLREGELLFATFVRLEGEEARAAWSRVEPVHPAVVRKLLERAAAGPVASGE